MTILTQHHPDDNLLAEFAAGSLPEAHAIAVSAHLHYWSFESIGGAVLSNSQSTSNDAHTELESSFDQLMSRINANIAINEATSINSSTNLSDSASSNLNTDQAKEAITKSHELPKLIQKMVNDSSLQWKRVSSSLRSASLVSGQKKCAVSLQKIKAGGIAPEHNHRGKEMTVVLEGSFSDEDGVYHEGDFLLKQSGDIHRPRASRNQDCL